MKTAGDELLHRLEGKHQPQETNDATVLRASARDRDDHQRHEATTMSREKGVEEIVVAVAADGKPAAKKVESVTETSVLAAVLAEQRNMRQEVATLTRSLQRIEALLTASSVQPPKTTTTARPDPGAVTALSGQHRGPHAPPAEKQMTKATGDVTA